MTKDILIWLILIFFIMIPAGILAMLSAKAVRKTFNTIEITLRSSGYGLSPNHRDILLKQLLLAPSSASLDNNTPEAQAIMKQHVDELLTYQKKLKRYKWMLLGINSIIIISYNYIREVYGPL